MPQSRSRGSSPSPHHERDDSENENLHHIRGNRPSTGVGLNSNIRRTTGTAPGSGFIGKLQTKKVADELRL